MCKTDLDTFQQSIIRTGGYVTADGNRASERRRPSGWLTFVFSLLVTRVFPFCAVADLFRRLTSRRWAEFCFSTVTCPESCGMKVTVEGFGDRNAHQGPVMYLCNHMSTYETVALPPILLCWGEFNFVAKDSLTRLPLLKHAAAIMGMVGVSRTNPKADLLKLYDVGTKNIAAGKSFLVFPQGTRQEVFSRGRFSSIGAKLAEKAGIPICPIVVDSRCMPTRKGGFLKRFFKDFGPVDTSKDVRIAAGPLIPCGKSREMHEATFNWMADKLESWGLPVER